MPWRLPCTEDWWSVEGWKGRDWSENWVQPAGGMWKEGHGPGSGPREMGAGAISGGLIQQRLETGFRFPAGD